MIIAVGGEFLDVHWTGDGALVGVDMDGRERVRMTWDWPHADRPKKTEIVWDITAVLTFARLQLHNGGHALDDPGRNWALTTTADLLGRPDPRHLREGG